MMDKFPTAPFVMHGARDAMAAGLVHEEEVKSIEEAVVENPGLAFDFAKTLVETVCKTILCERSVAYKEKDNLPTLFRSVIRTLSFLPVTVSNATEVRKSLEKTLSALHTAVQGICELRNKCGSASHGSGIARPALEGIQALLAAQAADTIVGFLHRVHCQDRTLPPTSMEFFSENSTFNESLDETFGPFRIFEAEFHPSEVLFKLEPETYRIYLADFDGDGDSEVIPSDSTEVQP